MIRLPNRLLFDIGHGVHSEEKYSEKFDVVDMFEYDIETLKKNTYNINRRYSCYYQNLSINNIEKIIRKYLNLIQINIKFKVINPEYPLLYSVIKSSIVLPNQEKVTQILKTYKQPEQFLIGAFASKKLIAVIGFELKDTQATIKHISVTEQFKRGRIGHCLIQKIIKDHALNRVSLETDEESVGFYRKFGFKCQSFDSEYGKRYRCHLSLRIHCH